MFLVVFIIFYFFYCLIDDLWMTYLCCLTEAFCRVFISFRLKLLNLVLILPISQLIRGFNGFVLVCWSFGVKLWIKRTPLLFKNHLKVVKFLWNKIFYWVRHFSRSTFLNLLFFGFFHSLGINKSWPTSLADIWGLNEWCFPKQSVYCE